MAEDILRDFDQSRFRLGGLCKRGHDWNGTGKSLRHLKSNTCYDCRRTRAGREQSARDNQAKQAEMVRLSVLAEALDFDKEKFYLGVLCKRGHDYQGTGGSLRRCFNWSCCECHEERRRQPEVKQKLAQSSRDWVIRNRERVRASNHASYLRNRARIRERAKRWMEANPERWQQWLHQYRETNREKMNQYQRQWTKTPQGRASRQKVKSKRRSAHSANYCRKALIDRLRIFDGLCAYCREAGGSTADHFIPVSRGGSDCLSNLLPCCPRCNSSKHDADPYEWFRKKPFFSKRRWGEILAAVGKTQANYNQIPLF